MSILVQVEGHTILFDTGAESAAVRNADHIGINFADVDTIILSHAHRDHTGGLKEVMKRTNCPEIIVHPALWNAKFKRVSPDQPLKYNGIPYRREEIEKDSTLRLSKEPVQISQFVMTSGEISQTTNFERIEDQYFYMENEILKPDDFIDEQFLIIQTPEGLVIISGCAHRGIINTICHAQNITGEDKVHTVIGGTHLFPKSQSDVNNTISELMAMNIEHIGVSHCTGLSATMQLASVLGDHFFPNNTGSVYTIRFDS